MRREEIERLVGPIFQAQLTPLAPTTRTEYAAAVSRLKGRAWREYAYSKKLGKRAAAVMRAAWRDWQASRIINCCECLEREQDPARQSEHIGALRALVEELRGDLNAEQYQPPPDAKKAGQTKKAKRRTAKIAVSGLEGWLLNCRPSDAIPLFIMAATGARPEELKIGVGVRISRDGILTAAIQGAKVSKHTGGGQARRKISVDLNMLQLSEDWIRIMRNQSFEVKIEANQSWQKRVSRAADRAGLSNVSPYSLRHAFAALVKGAGQNDEWLSAALGHVSPRTRKHYGHANQGRSGRGLVDVQAEREVRRPARFQPGERPGRRG
ncbi:MAG: site-specific integrase [Betaproteobacteria bacterium]|nr:site-specific integrase [Betaproteobacteria bacterium]